MKLETVWVVRDPGPHSELSDCIWSTTFARLSNYSRGCSSAEEWEREHHAVYTLSDEALADVLGRFRRLQPRHADQAVQDARAYFGFPSPGPSPEVVKKYGVPRRRKGGAA